MVAEELVYYKLFKNATLVGPNGTRATPEEEPYETQFFR